MNNENFDGDPDSNDGKLKAFSGKNMGFLDHVEDLRWTILKTGVVFLIAFVTTAIFLPYASRVLNWPLDRAFASLETSQPMGLVTTSPMAVFSVYLQICFLGGLLFALPFGLYFLGGFVGPALTKKEKKLLIPACLSSLILFLSGAAFAYFFLVPSAIKVSIYFNHMLGFDLVWSADRYYGLLVWMILGMGGGFQFPMVIQILVYLGIVEVKKLKSLRKVMIVVFFIISAIITPTPDPLTQSMVALPMYALYELSLLVAARVERRRKAREEA
jgi:sec-independent protein translocase protein TatC